jgi:carbamoyltransferase
LGNSILKQSGLFEGIHVPPCPNDVGLHFGAACFAQFKNNQPIELPENIALLGREYSQEEIENSLKESEVSYEKYENFEELCEFTALQLNSNKIIGWFQNRSEFGPRALGSRSLLMHPGPAENKDLINERVKHREYWRPFAGIILEKNLTDYFNEDFNSPYMLYSLTVKDEKRNEIAAITHKDNTCRIQTVNAKLNPQVNTLIEKFKEISGIPVLLNTSFNDNGEPIVESPQDAVRSFKNMDIDYLVIGNFIVRKS